VVNAVRDAAAYLAVSGRDEITQVALGSDRPRGVGVDLYVETVAIRIAPVRAVTREVIGARLAQEVQVEVRLGRGDTPDVAERGESGSEKATRTSVGYSQADRRVPMENGAGRLAVRVSGAVLEEVAPLLLAASD
jgi:hypothetical protein